MTSSQLFEHINLQDLGNGSQEIHVKIIAHVNSASREVERGKCQILKLYGTPNMIIRNIYVVPLTQWLTT
jgi:hypothetical protein